MLEALGIAWIELCSTKLAVEDWILTSSSPRLKVKFLTDFFSMKRSSNKASSSSSSLSVLDYGILLFFLLLLNSSIVVVGTQHNSNNNNNNNSNTKLNGNNNCMLASQEDCNSLLSLKLQGHISFASSDTSSASRDFGNMGHEHDHPAVLFPASVSDISTLVKHAYLGSQLVMISAKGAGHSMYGQARPASRHGIVIEMGSLRGIEVFVGAHGEVGYVDASAGELWVDVVSECLKKGLAPRSFTDYLHLSVGGTLSNAGISGQAFRYGPQISNVLQLEVVTGKGEVVTCSPLQNADLFFAVLGGLGQFGVITRARILLEQAPNKVRWIRALYSDFAAFSRDQEFLISQPRGQSFDYIEGSVIVNKGDSPQGWTSVPFHGQVLNASLIPKSAGPVLYCLELTKNHYADGSSMSSFEQKVASLLAPLSHVPSLIFSSDIQYFKFLNRVHDDELRLRQQGLWQSAHPWMNLFVPRSSIAEFDAYVFKQLLQDGINGPLLVYPLDRVKWDLRMSAVTPDEDVFYAVGILRYVVPGTNVNRLLSENQDILSFCRNAGIGFKQYLPHYTTEAEWKGHFGSSRWNTMVRRKNLYDPQAILSTGQQIFTRRQPSN